MSRCLNCGAELDAGAKFCMECGTPVPQVKKCIRCGTELPLRAKFCFGCGALQDGAPAGAGVNMGDKNVIAGDVVGQKVAGDNVQSKIMGNAIYNTFHDETKKIISCHICGKHLTNDNAYSCPNCSEIVCEDHFNKKLNCCNSCIKSALKKITVAEDGSGDFKSISDAIANAANGTTIIVKPGTYKEHFIVDKEIVLQGESDSDNQSPVIWDDTTIFNSVITVAANAKIVNFRIMGKKEPIPDSLQETILSSPCPSSVTANSADKFWPKAIYIQSSCSITGVEIRYSAGYGVAVTENVDSCKIEKCNIHENVRSGIYIADNSKVSIEMGFIYANKVGCMFHASDIFLWNVIFANNKLGINSVSSHVKMETCTVYENETGCCFSKATLSIKNCSFGGAKVIKNNLRISDYLDAVQPNIKGSMICKTDLTIERSFFFDSFAIANPLCTNITDSYFKFGENKDAKISAGICIRQNQDADPPKIQISNTTFDDCSMAVLLLTKNYLGDIYFKNCTFEKNKNGAFVRRSDCLWNVHVDCCRFIETTWTNNGDFSNIKFENENKEKIRVSQKGPADFATITEATHFAEDNATIFVEYGEYHEHFTIDKPITIIGVENEDGHSPIIKSSIKEVKSCICINAKTVLKNIDVKSIDSADIQASMKFDEEDECSAVYITNEAVLEKVGVDGWYGGILITGNGSSARIHDCSIWNNNHGIGVFDGANAVVEDCDFSFNNNVAIVAEKDSKANIVNCTFEHNDELGIVCEDYSECSVEKCRVSYNNGLAIAVRQADKFQICDSEIKCNKGGGIREGEGAQCWINKCNIVSNSEYGILVHDPNTTINISDSDISLNEGFGIYIGQQAQGSCNNCEITHNDKDGIHVEDEVSFINIKKSKIQNNEMNGVSFSNSAGGVIEECDITKNKERNILIEDGCSPDVDLDTLFASDDNN